MTFFKFAFFFYWQHSDAFNRTVKLYQMMSKLGSGGSTAAAPADEVSQGGGEETRKKGGGISAKDIAKNPAMAKMFILAAKKFKAVQERERLEAEKDKLSSTE